MWYIPMCVVSVCVGAHVCKQTCNYTRNSQVYTDCSPPYTEARYIAHWNPETEDSDIIASHTTGIIGILPYPPCIYACWGI